VIDTSTDTVTATVPVGTFPTCVAVSPNQKFVYVSDYFSNSESIIDTATNTVTGSVPVGSNPVGVIIANVPGERIK
jgi:YVTN family beta-propeller protein